MKNVIYIAAILSTLLFASCRKDFGNNPNLTFWTAVNCSPNPITVSIGNQTAVMTEYYPTVPPVCGSPGCASFNLSSGNYNYTATNGDTSWQGSVSVTKGGCNLQQLLCTTGSVTFWVDSAANNIRVKLNGATANINTAFPTSTPTCGSSGCANFTMHTGTYSYTATTASNIGYAGTVTITADSCTLVRLY